jgi:hypothetical protein
MDGVNFSNQKNYQDNWQDQVLVLDFTNDFNGNIKRYCGSDYAWDANTRRSVTGYVIYRNNCPIHWKSSGKKAVALSSTEAGYIELLEMITEIMDFKRKGLEKFMINRKVVKFMFTMKFPMS